MLTHVLLAELDRSESVLAVEQPGLCRRHWAVELRVLALLLRLRLGWLVRHQIVFGQVQLFNNNYIIYPYYLKIIFEVERIYLSLGLPWVAAGRLARQQRDLAPRRRWRPATWSAAPPS